MGVTEPFKRWRRTVDLHSIPFVDKPCRWYGRLATPSRRIIFLLLFLIVIFFYYGPYLSYFFSSGSLSSAGQLQKCIDDHIHQMYYKSGVVDDFVFYKDVPWSENNKENDNKYSPIVGNGHFGVSFFPKPTVYLKDGRTLTLNTEWNPAKLIYSGSPVLEVYYTNVLKGTVSHYQCVNNGLRISSTFFAHRTIPHLFYQDIVIYNPTNIELTVDFEKMKYPSWFSFHVGSSRSSGLLGEEASTHTFSGIIKNISNHECIAACVTTKGVSSPIQVPPHRTKHYTFPVIINSETFNTEKFINARLHTGLERKCNDLLKNISAIGSLKWEQDHISSWNNLWRTGLTISQSKAAGALNNDHINATVYYVLSSVTTQKNQTTVGFPRPTNATSYTPVVEGCYGGYHHTLQAINLWRELKTFKTINDCVNLWLLTLEKQGCHRLLMTGAEGVVQAMVLSFGGFRFSPHHLEFKIEPKFLHRDYKFRSIQVDLNTFINVSVILQENNKAVLAVCMIKAERDYWACDGGCIDEPVKLSPKETIFPVKITEPSTSILYITPDRNHMELIKDTLHVHKIVEAPAHDHHVVALHRHGSHLGGLPIMFWATVITLIVIFHLFLCKLIYNEYCGKQDRGRNRYSRVPSGRGV